jgi:uncharacterized protein (DUF1800 family)
MDTSSIVAAIRFGLGPRPDQPLPADPVGWLKGQLNAPEPPLPLPEGWERMPTVTDGLTISSQQALMPPAPGEVPANVAFMRLESSALLRNMLATDMSFRERLVLFWANHLTVSVKETAVRVLIGDYVRTVIRPHVTGHFADMLVAAARHPAMIFYLNQNASFGPNSPVGKQQKRGLNENLAREIIELHTLSPAAGYTQADVTEFARLLTGLSVERSREPMGSRFLQAAHEPGPRTILGHTFEEGPEQIDTALRWLAEHKATHRHLALKLARHFVSDTPPPEVVEKLFSILRDTRGDLKAVSEALVELPQAWSQPLAKLRAPMDFVIAGLRTLNAGPEMAGIALSSMSNLGHDIWAAPAPIGWPDRADYWLNPEGVMQRMEVAYNIAGRFARLNPNDVVQTGLGSLARPETIQAIRRAGSTRDGLTLLLSSPEFQRR